jgi:hypothetical protein
MVDRFSALFAPNTLRCLETHSENVVHIVFSSAVDEALRDHTEKKIRCSQSYGQPCSTIWAMIAASNFDKATRRRLLTACESILAPDQVSQFREFADKLAYFILNRKSAVYNIADTEFGHLGEVAMNALEVEGCDVWSWLGKAFSGIWQWDENGVLCDQYEVEENAYSNDDISNTILQLVDAITATDAYAQYQSGFEL